MFTEHFHHIYKYHFYRILVYYMNNEYILSSINVLNKFRYMYTGCYMDIHNTKSSLKYHSS